MTATRQRRPRQSGPDRRAEATDADAAYSPFADPFAEPLPLPPTAWNDLSPPSPGVAGTPGMYPGPLDPPPFVDPAEFAASFGEPIGRTLNLDTWSGGIDLAAALDRLEAEVAHALTGEDRLRAKTRDLLFPHLAPNGGGVYQVTRAQIEHAQRNVLFNGAIEAADGLCAVHDTLPLTVAQIGVCLTAYGDRATDDDGRDDVQQGTYGHRLFRRDLRIDAGDPVEEALAILERRELRADLNRQGRRDLLSHLFRRGILAWAQRAVLLKKSSKPWRMGHGHPAPHEMLTGSGSVDLLGASLEVLRGLILEHKRFLFVPSESGERMLLTFGNALRPGEFAVVESVERRWATIAERWDLRGPHRRAAQEFFEDAAPRVMAGVYRTYAETPPQVFYAHRDHVQEAAVIAMADSLSQSHRTFPALLDLAETACEGLFGAEGFNSSVQAAYAGRGHPLRYVSERQTKR